MRVKVGEIEYSGIDTPIMVILDDVDKENIRNMTPEATMYCCYPEHWTSEEIKEWMGIKDESN
jgi:hypothetical protein